MMSTVLSIRNSACDEICESGNCRFADCQTEAECPGGLCEFHNCNNPSCKGTPALLIIYQHYNNGKKTQKIVDE